MKEENKVWLWANIFEETQKRFPHVNMRKFKVLFHGWTRQNVRRGHFPQHFYDIWKRGWLSKRDADDFRKYIGLA